MRCSQLIYAHIFMLHIHMVQYVLNRLNLSTVLSFTFCRLSALSENKRQKISSIIISKRIIFSTRKQKQKNQDVWGSFLIKNSITMRNFMSNYKLLLQHLRVVITVTDESLMLRRWQTWKEEEVMGECRFLTVPKTLTLSVYLLSNYHNQKQYGPALLKQFIPI